MSVDARLAAPGLVRMLPVVVGGFLLLTPLLAGGARLEPPASISSGGDIVAGYHTRLQSPESVLKAMDSGCAPRAPQELNALVHRSMAHGPSPRLRFLDNWLAWLVGLAWEDARTTQDPRRLAAKGVGLCSDAVLVLIELAARAGLDVEMVDLRGHVVARTEWEGTTWILDPDLGVAFVGDLDRMRVKALDGSLDAALRDRGHGDRIVTAYVDCALRAPSGTVVPSGLLSPRLALAERLLSYAGTALALALTLTPLLRRA